MSVRYQVIETQDGSHTLQLTGSPITFHSTKGAIQESRHVFIESGLEYFIKNNPLQSWISILEVGFGTGLNTLLSAIHAGTQGRCLHYTALDLYPLAPELYHQLNYPQLLHDRELYQAIMAAAWGKSVQVRPFLQLRKTEADLISYVFKDTFDIIYFDAFAPEDQLEMWEDPICEKMFGVLNKGGVLVTYCSKSRVRKSLLQAGFTVGKLPGPLGKREMIRALKP